MGGEGSGRHPSAETLLKRQAEQFIKTTGFFNQVELPNISHIQKAALKSQSGMTEGSIVFIDAAGQLAQDNSNLFWDNSNNRLGIGTTNPSELLHTLGGNLLIEKTGIDSAPETSWKNDAREWTWGVRGAISDNFILRDQTAGGDIITIDTSVKVGIGTTGPNTKLEVYDGDIRSSGTATRYMQVLDRGNNGVLQAYLFGDLADDDIGGMLYNHANNSLRFDVNAATRMTINNAGKVGIGTITPDQLLSISGGAFASNNRGAGSPTLDLTQVSGAFFISGGSFFYKGDQGTVTLLAGR